MIYDRCAIYTHKLVKLASLGEGDQRAPFSIAAIPKCRGGRYSIHRIAPLNS